VDDAVVSRVSRMLLYRDCRKGVYLSVQETERAYQAASPNVWRVKCWQHDKMGGRCIDIDIVDAKVHQEQGG
jgi:hypothetical protein